MGVVTPVDKLSRLPGSVLQAMNTHPSVAFSPETPETFVVKPRARRPALVSRGSATSALGAKRVPVVVREPESVQPL